MESIKSHLDKIRCKIDRKKNPLEEMNDANQSPWKNGSLMNNISSLKSAYLQYYSKLYSIGSPNISDRIALIREQPSVWRQNMNFISIII